MIILALDALDLHSVLRYNCQHLQQTQYGQVDVSEFTRLRTVALWASFLSGTNRDASVPLDKERQWQFQLAPDQTFLPLFDTYTAIDVPAFSFKQDNHARERQAMRRAFADASAVNDFEAVVWRHHEENKKEFFHALHDADLVLGYFDLADAIGHVSFGVPKTMQEVYRELDALAKDVQSSVDDVILITSDHGMRPLGRYGDHWRYGFYSMNATSSLYRPKITAFHQMIARASARDHPGTSRLIQRSVC